MKTLEEQVAFQAGFLTSMVRSADARTDKLIKLVERVLDVSRDDRATQKQINSIKRDLTDLKGNTEGER